MSFVKNKLKAARDFLGKKDYAGAKDAASQILEYEPDNYNAYETTLELRCPLNDCRNIY